jgi:hypothetical protein
VPPPPPRLRAHIIASEMGHPTAACTPAPPGRARRTSGELRAARGRTRTGGGTSGSFLALVRRRVHPGAAGSCAEKRRRGQHKRGGRGEEVARPAAAGRGGAGWGTLLSSAIQNPIHYEQHNGRLTAPGPDHPASARRLRAHALSYQSRRITVGQDGGEGMIGARVPSSGGAGTAPSSTAEAQVVAVASVRKSDATAEVAARASSGLGA